jgi:galactofuranosylgalactofuranosylrhamnosyl-N-acetylglucosaminyl-diphospho-decaprenol beta-1,5/1,6-galactofuranosyltransferase
MSEQGYRVRTRDRALALSLTRRAARTFRRFVTEGPGVARQFRAELPHVSSRSNWARLYGVDE